MRQRFSCVRERRCFPACFAKSTPFWLSNMPASSRIFAKSLVSSPLCMGHHSLCAYRLCIPTSTSHSAHEQQPRRSQLVRADVAQGLGPCLRYENRSHCSPCIFVFPLFYAMRLLYASHTVCIGTKKAAAHHESSKTASVRRVRVGMLYSPLTQPTTT